MQHFACSTYTRSTPLCTSRTRPLSRSSAPRRKRKRDSAPMSYRRKETKTSIFSDCSPPSITPRCSATKDVIDAQGGSTATASVAQYRAAVLSVTPVGDGVADADLGGGCRRRGHALAGEDRHRYDHRGTGEERRERHLPRRTPDLWFHLGRRLRSIRHHRRFEPHVQPRGLPRLGEAPRTPLCPHAGAVAQLSRRAAVD